MTFVRSLMSDVLYLDMIFYLKEMLIMPFKINEKIIICLECGSDNISSKQPSKAHSPEIYCESAHMLSPCGTVIERIMEEGQVSESKAKKILLTQLKMTEEEVNEFLKNIN